jgi:hypothetical protein
MNIYKAVRFERILKEGSTLPWAVEVVVEDENLQSFVVKVFKRETLAQYNAVAHEFIANELAQLLDLNVPEKAWVEFDDNFITQLPDELKDKVASNFIDKRLKFGTVYIDNATTFSLTEHFSALETWEYEDIYAFDNLIFNGDRHSIKPNILLKKDEYYLIDHELSFMGFSQKSITSIETLHTKFPYQKHIFYSILQQQKDKNRLFETFEESLRNLRIRNLEKTFPVLEAQGYAYAHQSNFLNYLRHVKANSRNFVTTLRRQLA